MASCTKIETPTYTQGLVWSVNPLNEVGRSDQQYDAINVWERSASIG